MTVASPYVPPQYSGNGVTTVFAFSAPFFDPIELIVDLLNTSTNVAVSPVAVLNGAATYDYTVTGTKDPDTGEYLSGGYITFNTAPPGNFRITIYRAVIPQQNTVLINNAKFPAKVVEGSLDRAMMIIQQLLDGSNRDLRAPSSDVSPSMVLPAAAIRASKYLMFDASGNAALATLPVLSTIAATASQEVFVSQASGADNEARLVNADAAAVILGGVVVVDRAVTLTANRTLAAPRVRMAGGIITRGAFNLIFTGMVDCPDYIAFTEIGGAGSVTFANASCSLAWFGAKQDTAPLGATVTDNTVAWQKACASGSGGQVRIPCLNPTKAYAVTLGATITGATEVKQDDQAYFQHQSTGYLLTYQGGGGANKMHVALRGYGSTNGAGLIKYDSNTGYIEDDIWAYNYPNGEAIAYFGTTFNYAHKHLFVRNCKRIAKSYAAYGQFTNAVRFIGGVWHNDSTTAADPNGWIQLDRGNGWQISGKPDVQQMHATPVPFIKLAQIAYVDLNDGQVQAFDLGDCYIEGNYTVMLSVGAGATFPTSTQAPREIHARILQVSNAATQRMVDLFNVQGAHLEFGFTLGGQLWRYDANCDGIRIEMLQDTGLYTVNTAATHVLIESTRGLSYDNLVTTIIQPAGVQISTSRTITGGNGSPETVVVAPVGSLYLRSNGAGATSLYVKETGASNTGWVGK